MKAIYLVVFGLAAYYLGWRFYSRFIAEKIFRLEATFRTPAHEFEDGTDFLPTNKHVLWGHHFTSVAGAAPIVGPAIAVIWGWLPALIWVVLGTIFFAGVHDFGTLWASVRHKGQSVATLTRQIVGPRSRTLFLLIAFTLILMVNAVFAVVIANLFTAFPGSVVPIWFEIPVAVLVGWWVYRKKGGLLWPSIAALVALYVMVWFGARMPVTIADGALLGFTGHQAWIVIMFVYAAIASVLPVWVLLQPRDYINSHQLFVALGVIYAGIFLVNPEVVAPAFNTAVPAGTPSMVPLLFITIACGAISGFHGFVSSGTSSKQLDREPDARFVGYLGAVGEGTLALAAIIAATAAFGTRADWMAHYASWDLAGKGALTAFVSGVGKFAGGLGIPAAVGTVFASVVVVSFAATTMDTGMRLQRYILQELGAEYRIAPLTNGVVATIVAALTTVLLAFGADPSGKGGMIIWPLFGTTNQLVAGLSLLVISVFLKRLGRPTVYTAAPLVFLLVMTTAGMLQQLGQYYAKANWLLFSMGGAILVMEFWLIIEAIGAWRRASEQSGPQAAAAD